MRPVLLTLAVAICGCAAHSRPILFDDPETTDTREIERDLREAARQMASDVNAARAVVDFAGTPRIAVMPVENKTIELIDKDVLTGAVANALAASAAGHPVVLDAREAEQVKPLLGGMKREETDMDEAHVPVPGADFVLLSQVGRVSMDGSESARRTVVSFQLFVLPGGVPTWSKDYRVDADTPAMVRR